MSAESQELQEILSNIDVSDIASVEFFPANGESFRLDTDNIKKLTRYITTKRKKEYFQPHELDTTYGYIIDHLDSSISEDKYAEIRKQMKIFIEQGGKVEIHTQSVREKGYNSTGNSLGAFGKFFISIFIILFGGVLVLCGGILTFDAGRGLNLFLLPGFLAGIICLLLALIGLWKTERMPLIWYKIRLYAFIIFSITIILILKGVFLK